MCDPLAIITQPTRNWTRLSLITAITLLFTTSENDHLHTGVGAISKKKWRPKNSALIGRILRIIFATISDSAPKEESDTGSAATNSSLTGSGGRCPADIKRKCHKAIDHRITGRPPRQNSPPSIERLIAPRLNAFASVNKPCASAPTSDHSAPAPIATKSLITTASQPLISFVKLAVFSVNQTSVNYHRAVRGDLTRLRRSRSLFGPQDETRGTEMA
ncbi:hypothetical protein GEV33_013329 [Tenebrio molitor]|uniref:Uncharacterized protein n=1 Tax=Tenebrio molitor TaxID=7067 RepID=A0A8J6H8Q1_TENMO|nr:hypothetical protein GEV33_013329 [Tenebrio molitor]